VFVGTPLHPCKGSHAAVLQSFVHPEQSRGWPAPHLPDWQVARIVHMSTVQSSPSLAGTDWSHAPVAGLHAAAWHASGPGTNWHVFSSATHSPLWQVPPIAHGFVLEHDVPSG
jgi:hypothetical protein